MTYNLNKIDLNTLSERDFLAAVWKDDGAKVLAEIDATTTTPMTIKEFLDHCTLCGGNWGGMLLTGIRKLYPAVWEAIPDDMGIYAWNAICTVCTLLDIKCEE